MENSSRSAKIPERMYQVWSVLFGLGIIGAIASVQTNPSDFLGPFIKVFAAALFGYFFIALYTTIFFWNWFKKTWPVNSLFLCAGLFLVGFLVQTTLTEPEYIEERFERYSVGKDTIESSKEVYMHTKQLRSIRYWKNGRKDSVWVYYDKKGNLTKKLTYRNDSLINSSQ